MADPVSTAFDFQKKHIIIKFPENSREITVPFAWIKAQYSKIIRLEEIGVMEENGKTNT